MDDVTSEEKPAAIDVLPPEVLQNIFSSCTDNLPFKPRLDELPWLLTQVCSSWRHIAIAHAALWSSVIITVNHPRYPGVWVDSDGSERKGLCDPPFDVLACWLGRSAKHPLSIKLYLEFAHFDEEFPSSIPQQVFKLLHSHIDHTKTLTLRAPEAVESPLSDDDNNDDDDDDDVGSDHYTCPPLLDGAMALEHLELSHMSEIFSSLSSTNFPRLRQFSWTGDSTKLPRLPIPWARLQELALCHRDMVHYVDCLNILKETPELESFKTSIIFDCDQSHCTYAGANIPLSHLTTLDINGTVEGLSAFFQYVQAPSVQSLVLSLYEPFFSELEEIAMLSPRLNNFFACNQSSLRSLIIDNLSIPADQLIQWLRHVSPTLIDLKISFLPKVDENILWPFVVREGDMNSDIVLCPQLESLTLESCLAAPVGMLANMVETRTRHPQFNHPFSRLRVTILGMEAATYSDDRTNLEQLKSDGRLRILDWVEPDDDDDW